MPNTNRECFTETNIYSTSKVLPIICIQIFQCLYFIKIIHSNYVTKSKRELSL